MLREWKANVWLILELVIVVLILQYLLGTLYALYTQHGYAGGQKLEDVYFADFGILQKDSEGYVEWDSIHTWQSDLDLLMTQLRGNQYVEVAAVGGFNSLPYNYNFMGNRYYYKTPDGKKSHEFTVNVRNMSPEMMEVLQMHGLKGETPKQLADMLRRGEIILGEAEEPESPDDPKALDAVGNEAFSVADSLTSWHVGAASTGMRRNDYEELWHKTVYAPINDEQSSMIAVRVKPGTGNRFLESLTDKDRQAGNVYLSNMESVSDMRDRVHLDINQAIRNAGDILRLLRHILVPHPAARVGDSHTQGERRHQRRHLCPLLQRGPDHAGHGSRYKRSACVLAVQGGIAQGYFKPA